MIDWVIDGVMEVRDASIFNKMHDAKPEFHHQLFKCERRSYYGAKDIQVLDERRAVANVGWLRRLVFMSLSSLCRPSLDNKSSLADIDISKVYTGGVLRIKAGPAFSEFDIWQPHEADALGKHLSLYIVEPNSFDLFCHKRNNLCYGYFLKRLNQGHATKAVKRPSVIIKVSYIRLTEEL